MKKFYKEYLLLKDTPELKAGQTVKWNPWKERFTDIGDWAGLNPPPEKVSYTLELIESKPQWFDGVGEQRDYYPPFPNKKDFYEYEGCGHHYVGLELGHNQMCRFCTVMGRVDFEQEAKDAMYELAKKKYEEFVKKNS
jgi:hypothetical protein